MPAGSLSAIATTLFFSLSLASPCFAETAGGDKPIAKIGDRLIFERELAGELSGVRGSTEEDRARALDRVLRMHLMAGEALRLELNKRPEVNDALDRAKNQILAQAYLDAQARSLTPPSPEEIEAFYQSNPVLFSERAIYELTELSIKANSDQIILVDKNYGKMKTLNEMATWLDQQGIEYKKSVSVRPAEEVPADLLMPVANLEPGQVIKVQTDLGVSIVQLTGKGKEPYSLEKATPTIARFLKNNALGASMAEKINAIEGRVNIEIYPPYVQKKN